MVGGLVDIDDRDSLHSGCRKNAIIPLGEINESNSDIALMGIRIHGIRISKSNEGTWSQGGGIMM